MRALRTGALALAAAAVAGAAVPAVAADGSVRIANSAYAPSTVTIAPGEQVTWTWAGPDTNHSVTADAGQSESFDSDPGGSAATISHPAGATFTHRFTQAGRFTFHCRVHSFMTGTVKVEVPDTSTPVVSGLKVKPKTVCPKHAKTCTKPGGKVAFTLSEDARVAVEVRTSKQVVKKQFSRAGRKGSNALALSAKGLAPGSYRVRLVATDDGGRASAPAVASFKVRTP